MSRRIVFALLASSAALIATPAAADRECFENSCRLPDVIEAPAQAAAPSADAADAQAGEAATQHQVAREIVAAEKPATAVVRPKAIGESALGLKPATPRRSAEAMLPPGPNDPAAEPAAVRTADASSTGSIHAGEVMPAPAVTVTGRRDASSGSLIVQVPQAVHAEQTVVTPVYPYLRDPAWRLCQIDGPSRSVDLCGPHSYYPYGEYGYRPAGTYQPYRSAPTYMVAPSAKIISIEPAN